MEPPADKEQSPTTVRYFVLAAATVMSVLLYLDRFAVTIPLEYIREDLRMTQTQVAWFVSAFFWSYALCQVPAGWLSDRFGARAMLTLYIVAWSAMTGLMGISHAIWMLLWLRVFCGASQAGAYPTAGGLIRHWYPVSQRGTASSIVGLGGRFGGVLAPILTAWLIVIFVSAQPDPRLTNDDILDDDAFIARFESRQVMDLKNDLALRQQQFATAFLDTLPDSQRSTFVSFGRSAESRIKERESLKETKTQSVLDFRDWIPNTNDLTGVTPISRSDGIDEIVHAISQRMASANFLDLVTADDARPFKLPGHAQKLIDQRQVGTRFSESDAIRLNRFILETLFPAEIRKSRGLGWRQTLVVYGVLGILVALLFAVVVRNGPQCHPWCNKTEKNFINDKVTQQQAALEPQNPVFPWRAFLIDASLWGSSSTQFLTNVGWFFVVNSLPRYLDTVHHVPLITIGFMTAFPMGAGILGLFCGGRCTDWAVRRMGLKWGRRLPIVISRFTAAAGYGLCLIVSSTTTPGSEDSWLPWIYVAGLCLAAASTDFGSPAIWAFAQDVGGRYTGSILGWANMWGNFGAAFAPLIYNSCLGEKPRIENWNTVFAVCCGVFVVAGLCALLLDATKPLTVDRAPTGEMSDT